MKKFLPILIIALLAASAFATEAEYGFREAVRTGVVEAIWSVDASTPGHLTVGTNLTVGNVATFKTLALTGTAQAAPTNATSKSLQITVGGTNYWIPLSIPNE